MSSANHGKISYIGWVGGQRQPYKVKGVGLPMRTLGLLLGTQTTVWAMRLDIWNWLLDTKNMDISY